MKILHSALALLMFFTASTLFAHGGDEQSSSQPFTIEEKGKTLEIENFSSKTIYIRLYNEMGQLIKRVESNDPHIEISLEGLEASQVYYVAYNKEGKRLNGNTRLQKNETVAQF